MSNDRTSSHIDRINRRAERMREIGYPEEIIHQCNAFGLLHEDLLDHMANLGYPVNPFLDSSDKGLCFGFGHMAMQAFLAGDLQTFIKRLVVLSKISPETLSENLQTIKSKIIAKQPLTEEEQKLNHLNIPAFFDGVELYHQAEKHKSLWALQQGKGKRKEKGKQKKSVYSEDNPPPFEQDENPIKVKSFVESEQLEQLGGIIQLQPTPEEYEHRKKGYEQNKFEGYFQRLEKELESFGQATSLIVTSPSHAITVCYNPASKIWTFIDINTLDIHPETFSARQTHDPSEITKWIILGLSIDYQLSLEDLDIQIYGVNDPNQSLQLSTENKKNPPTITIQNEVLAQPEQEKQFILNKNENNQMPVAQLALQNSLLEALQDRNTTRAKQCLEDGADPIYPTYNKDNDKITPLLIAAQHGNVDLVHLMLDKIQNSQQNSYYLAESLQKLKGVLTSTLVQSLAHYRGFYDRNLTQSLVMLHQANMTLTDSMIHLLTDHAQYSRELAQSLILLHQAKIELTHSIVQLLADHSQHSAFLAQSFVMLHQATITLTEPIIQLLAKHTHYAKELAQDFIALHQVKIALTDSIIHLLTEQGKHSHRLTQSFIALHQANIELTDSIVQLLAAHAQHSPLLAQNFVMLHQANIALTEPLMNCLVKQAKYSNELAQSILLLNKSNIPLTDPILLHLSEQAKSSPLLSQSLILLHEAKIELTDTIIRHLFTPSWGGQYPFVTLLNKLKDNESLTNHMVSLLTQDSLQKNLPLIVDTLIDLKTDLATYRDQYLAKIGEKSQESFYKNKFLMFNFGHSAKQKIDVVNKVLNLLTNNIDQPVIFSAEEKNILSSGELGKKMKKYDALWQMLITPLESFRIEPK